MQVTPNFMDTWVINELVRFVGESHNELVVTKEFAQPHFIKFADAVSDDAEQRLSSVLKEFEQILAAKEKQLNSIENLTVSNLKDNRGFKFGIGDCTCYITGETNNFLHIFFLKKGNHSQTAASLHVAFRDLLQDDKIIINRFVQKDSTDGYWSLEITRASDEKIQKVIDTLYATK